MIRPAPVDPPELNRILWERFRTGRVAFDVGANCGQTLERIHANHERVVAFEPAAEAYDYLLDHFSNRIWLALSDLAVSDQTGEIELMAAPSKIETGQLVTHGTAGMEWSDDEMANGVARTLKSTTLDDYCRNHRIWPDFIKIDVEGHEGKVLAGAAEVLKRKPEMLIEVHSEWLGEHIAELLAPSYDLITVRHPHYPANSTLWKTHFWYICLPKPDSNLGDS